MPGGEVSNDEVKSHVEAASKIVFHHKQVALKFMHKREASNACSLEQEEGNSLPFYISMRTLVDIKITLF